MNFVTTSDARRQLAPLAASLLRALGPRRLAGVVNTVAARGRPQGERRARAEHVLVGEGRVVDALRGVELEVSANAFFQTNTRQADALLGLVAEAAGGWASGGGMGG